MGSYSPSYGPYSSSCEYSMGFLDFTDGENIFFIPVDDKI